MPARYSRDDGLFLYQEIFFHEQEGISTIKNKNVRCHNLIAAALLVFCFFLFTQCRFNSEENKQAGNMNIQWFRLDQGTLASSASANVSADAETGANASAGTDRDTDAAPWTIAGRIADFAVFKGMVCCAVNNYGIVFCNQGKNNRIEFTECYSPDFFMGRTITAILPVRENILCHLYFNSILFPFEQKDSYFKSPNLLAIAGEKGNYVIKAMYPHQPESDPYWEITGFLAENTDKFFLEWKKTGKAATGFRYSCYFPDDRKETDISRDDFLSAYHFIKADASGNPRPLTLLFEKIISVSGQNKNQTACIFRVKDTQTGLIRFYRKEAGIPLTDNRYELLHIMMRKDKTGYYGLLKTGNIYFINNNREDIQILRLPLLPPDFHYTDFIVHKNSLFVSWEQSDFLNISAAGLLVITRLSFD